MTAWWQVARQTEGKLKLHHAHPIRAERERCRAPVDLPRQQPPGQRPVHPDMRLSGLTGGGNLPARDGLPRTVGQPGLNRIPILNGLRPTRSG